MKRMEAMKKSCSKKKKEKKEAMKKKKKKRKRFHSISFTNLFNHECFITTFHFLSNIPRRDL